MSWVCLSFILKSVHICFYSDMVKNDNRWGDGLVFLSFSTLFSLSVRLEGD